MPSQHQPEPARPAGPKIALTNVRRFDGRTLQPGSTVVISGGRIGTDPAGARIVDGQGGSNVINSHGTDIIYSGTGGSMTGRYTATRKKPLKCRSSLSRIATTNGTA